MMLTDFNVMGCTKMLAIINLRSSTRFPSGVYLRLIRIWIQILQFNFTISSAINNPIRSIVLNVKRIFMSTVCYQGTGLVADVKYKLIMYIACRGMIHSHTNLL